MNQSTTRTCEATPGTIKPSRAAEKMKNTLVRELGKVIQVAGQGTTNAHLIKYTPSAAAEKKT